MPLFENKAVMFETRVGLLYSFSLVVLQIALKLFGVFWGVIAWILVVFAFVVWVPSFGERATDRGDHWSCVVFHSLQIMASIVGIVYLVGFVRVLGPVFNKNRSLDLKWLFNLGFDLVLMQSCCQLLVGVLQLVFHLVVVERG